MKKVYTSFIALFITVVITTGQTTTLFEDNFDNQSYETNFPPAGWLLIDQDEDTNNWYWGFYAQDNDGYLLSRSFLNPNALTPDNWIITPQINLVSVPTGELIFLTFTVCPTATTPQYRTEHYGVFISTTGTNPSDFTMVYEETLLETMTNWEWLDRSIDISSFKGENIYIAFRHWNVTDKDRVAINDLLVYSQSDASVGSASMLNVSVHPNPASEFVKIEGVSDASVDIYSLNGTLVYSTIVKKSNSKVNVADLPSGLYTIMVQSGEQVAIQKLLIHR